MLFSIEKFSWDGLIATKDLLIQKYHPPMTWGVYGSKTTPNLAGKSGLLIARPAQLTSMLNLDGLYQEILNIFFINSSSSERLHSKSKKRPLF